MALKGVIEFQIFNGTFIDAKIRAIQLSMRIERVQRRTVPIVRMNESFEKFEEIKRSETKE